MIVWRKRLSLAALAIAAFFFTGVMAQTEPWQFIRDEEVIFDLLRNGEMNLSEDVAKALNQKQSLLEIRRIGLKKGSVQIRAAFRDAVINMHFTGDKAKYFDAYYNELAAYVVSKYLGLNIVPAIVLRSLPIASSGLRKNKKLREGTLQLWVENSAVYYELIKERITYPGDPSLRKLQISEIKAFDCIIGNSDRHAGNVLIDMNERFESINLPTGQPEPYLGKIWAIDHSRSFPSHSSAKSRRCHLDELNVQAISLVFIQRLRAWDANEVQSALVSSGLSQKQLRRLNLKALDHRVQKVKEHFETQQANREMSDDEFYSSGIWHRVW